MNAVLVAFIVLALGAASLGVWEAAQEWGGSTTVERSIVETDAFSPERARITNALEQARSGAVPDTFSPEAARAAGAATVLGAPAVEQRQAIESAQPPAFVQRYDVGNGHPDIRTASVPSMAEIMAQRIGPGFVQPETGTASTAQAESQAQLVQRYDTGLGHPIQVEPTNTIPPEVYDPSRGHPLVLPSTPTATPQWDGVAPAQLPG